MTRITRDPPETSELQAFVAVVEAGSVSAAADELVIPRATLSRRLAKLEERLGVRLMHRTTRQQILTALGEEFYIHARSILTAVEVARHAITQDEEHPHGPLRISVPTLASSGLDNLFLDFLDRYPDISLELIQSTRHEDLIEKNIDVALRAGSEFDAGLIARRILRTDAACVASPAYLERFGTPETVEALAKHRCLMGFERGERPATHWQKWSGEKVRVRGHLHANDVHFLLQAARRGQGIAMLPYVIYRKALDAGELVEVLEEELGSTHHIALVYPDKQFVRPAVRALIDFAVEWLGAHDGLIDPNLVEGC